MTTPRCLLLALLVLITPPALRAEDLATIKGRISLDGKPLAGGKVTFHLPDGQFTGAVTKADGTYCVDRLPPGMHIMTVEKITKGKALVPAKYADPATSALRLDVKKGESTHDIDLRSR